VITNTVTVTGDNGVVTDGDDNPAQDSESGQVCVGADLTATIDDSESLTRTFPWSIQKATTTPNVTVTNGAASATYDVTVTAGAQEDSDWHISGVVTVSNPNDWEDVPLTGLSVSYSGSNDANTGDDCVVTESLASPIPGGGSRTFHYNCTFSTQPDYDGTVDAAVTWDAAAANTPHGVPVAPVTTAVAEADWNVTEVDSTVTVHDDQATGQDIVIATLDWATVYAMDQHRRVIHYTVSLTGLPAAGSCNTKVNTVWIVGHDLVHLDADENSANNVATVQVCTPAIVVLPPKPPQQPHPHVLPNTGGPNAWVFAAGLALLLSGGALVLADQRRKRRS
jgi:LPXTG-motif cell wall-anchored protein